MTQLTVISVLVRDQDEALHFYTEKLGLEKRVDVTFAPGLRLLTVAPKGQSRPELALAKPDKALHGEDRIREVMEGKRAGMPWIFATEDCQQTYTMLQARGVKFVSAPTKQIYGIEAIFEDPYGNLFALLEVAPEVRTLFENRYVGSAA